MSTLATHLSRDVACATAAAVITLIAGLSFIASTAHPPGDRPAVVAGVQPHAWFGQPEPAVLVD
jgi:hypothetical protein